MINVPRPDYFNRSHAGNIGARYTFEELLFFLDCGMTFRDDSHLSDIVEDYKCNQRLEFDHYAQWRDTVADMMAEPRASEKFSAVFPAASEGWASGSP